MSPVAPKVHDFVLYRPTPTEQVPLLVTEVHSPTSVSGIAFTTTPGRLGLYGDTSRINAVEFGDGHREWSWRDAEVAPGVIGAEKEAAIREIVAEVIHEIALAQETSSKPESKSRSKKKTG